MNLVHDTQSSLGEGPVWVAQERSLYWVDILGERVYRAHNGSGRLEAFSPRLALTSIAPRKSGGFIGTTRRGE